MVEFHVLSEPATDPWVSDESDGRVHRPERATQVIAAGHVVY